MSRLEHRNVALRNTLGRSLYRSRRLGPAMWGAIGTSAALLLALLSVGLGARAVEVAAGVLLVACLGICLPAAHTSHRTGKTVDQLTRQVAARRDPRSQPVGSTSAVSRESR